MAAVSGIAPDSSRFQLRRPDSNRRYAAYETAALPLGYPAIDEKNWRDVPVLPRTRKALDASLRKLTTVAW